MKPANVTRERGKPARGPAARVAPMPSLPTVSPRAYIEFATFASRFTRAVKPAHFTGAHWKL